MFSVSDIRSSFCLSLLLLIAAPVRSATPDSLSIKDKAIINTLAASLFERYANMLNMIASTDAGDNEDAIMIDEMITSACKPGPGRVFIGTDAQIEDDVDPSQGQGSTGRNRTLKEYANDLLLFFTSTDPKGNPVEAHLLKKREPAIADHVFTQMLYDISFHGTHKEVKVPYRKQLRVLDLVAEKNSTGEWNVLISADSYFDTTKVFPEYVLDHDLASIQSGAGNGGAISAELEQYRSSTEEVKAGEERQIAQRHKAYTDAITAGKDYVAHGDFDNAIQLFEQAKTFDPLAIDPLVLTNKARQAKTEKTQRDKKEFNELMDRGQALRVMRDYDRALESYQRAAQMAPDDARPRTMVDTLNVLLRDKADREKYFRAANYDNSLQATEALMRTQHRPNDPELVMLQAKTYFAMNRKSDALRAVNAVLAKEPYFAEALLMRARIRERSAAQEDQMGAVEDYSTLMNHDGWNMLYYQHYAWLRCMVQKQPKEGVDILLKALKREPGNVETLYLLGRLYGFGTMTMNDFKASVNFLDNATARDSLCAKCFLEKGISLIQMDSADAAVRAVQRARAIGLAPEEMLRAKQIGAANIEGTRKLVELHLYQQADRLFEGACVLNPDTPAYRLMKAQNLMRIPRYEEAIADLTIHINATPAPYIALLERATCELALGQYDKALDDVAAVQRNKIEALASKADLIAGKACFAKGDMGCAESHLKETLRRDKKSNAEALALMAKICLTSGRLQEAKNFAEDALELDKANPENNFNLGLIKQQMKDQVGSNSCFQTALYYGYDRSAVIKQMGRSYMLGSKYKDALAQFEELRLMKDDPEAARWTATCYYQQERYHEALEQLTKLLAAHPEVEKEPDFLAELGFLYVLNELYPQAKETLDKAEAVDNKYKRTLLAKSAYLWKANRQQEGVDLLHDLLARGLVDDKELRTWPILRDVLASKMWKAKSP